MSFNPELEHAWCQELILNKELKIRSLIEFESFFPTMRCKRQRFDCRTHEAKLQRDILKIYEPRLLELDAKIEEITKSRFASLCNRQVSEHFIDFVGKDLYEKFERRISNSK